MIGGQSLDALAVSDLFLIQGAVQVVVLMLAGGSVVAIATVLFRWYARDRIPEGLAVLLSLAVVTLFLNTTGALRAVLDSQYGVLDIEVVVVNATSFLAAIVVVPVAIRLGDRFATESLAVSSASRMNGQMSQLVRSGGRVISVDLPESVTDIDGYDPVAPEKKADIEGATLVFPRRLTVVELHERIVDRLEDDFGVGHVDLEITADGTVEYLAVGSRAAGIGPTLPPRTCAVAIRADPPFSASPGDRVQVWEPGQAAPATDGAVDPTPPEGTEATTESEAEADTAAPASTAQEPKRIASAELRASAGDVVTLAVDDRDAAKLDDTTRYRLMTLPATPLADQEFTGVLRAADETMEVVTIGDGSVLVGSPAGALSVNVIAIKPAAGRIETIPPRTRTLQSGDTVYAIGRPDALRRLSQAASDSATDEAS